MTFAEHILSFNNSLEFSGELPAGIRVMNPFRDNPQIIPVTKEFYTKYYNDTLKRYLILGINPGRFGAGVTGIPFTDTRRMSEKCGITIHGMNTYEPSSVFVYDVIEAYGGTERFYSKFYINSVCPLGFTKYDEKGREVNYNYYDSKELTSSVYGFIVESIRQQLNFGVEREICYCLGTGKNADFLKKLNEKEKFFSKVIPLEHPRYVMQYKSKQKQLYINMYMEKLGEAVI